MEDKEKGMRLMEKTKYQKNGKDPTGDFIPIIAIGSSYIDNWFVKVAIIELDQGYMILITDQENFGIGTLSLASPPQGSTSNGISTSPFSIFGFKHNFLANLISKKASTKLRKPIISMVFIKEKNLKQEKIQKATINALDIALSKIKI